VCENTHSNSQYVASIFGINRTEILHADKAKLEYFDKICSCSIWYKVFFVCYI